MTGTSLGTPVRHALHASPVHEPPAAIRAAGVVIALFLALAVLAIAFALPAARSKPHGIPIGAAGPTAASGQVADMLEQHAPGAFVITYYPGEAALRNAIRNRDVYGGMSFGPGDRSLLIATGGSPMVAQMLTQIGTGIAQQSHMPLRIEDLAPPTARDPRGAGFAASALPITLAGLLPAIALVLVIRREIWTRLVTAVVFAAGAGVGIAALLRYLLGSIEGNIWPVAAGLTLGLLAAGLAMLGLGSLFGRVGLAIGGLWPCCWAIRCPDWPARPNCYLPGGVPLASGCRRVPPQRCCGRRPSSTVQARRPRSRC